MHFDRILGPDEQLVGAMELGQISIEKVGTAVMRALEKAWKEEIQHESIRVEQQQRIKDFREQLANERRLRQELVNHNEVLQQRIALRRGAITMHDFSGRETRLEKGQSILARSIRFFLQRPQRLPVKIAFDTFFTKQQIDRR